jgi:hypothetical protein
MNKLLVGMLACIFLLPACKKETSSQEKEVLAEVKGKYLFMSDLQSALPDGISPKDSVSFARSFIESWVTDQLVYNIASKNIPDKEKINQMVEEYRCQLITSEYQRYLIDEKLSKEISDEEVQSYYDSHANELKLKSGLIKGIFVKVPLNEPQRGQLRSWMALRNDEDVDKIGKYAIQHAADYDYFAEKWTDLNTALSKMPGNYSNFAPQIRAKRVVEVKDSVFYYMLAVSEFAPAGSKYPEDYAREEIRNQLIAQRKTSYLQQFRHDLLKKAMDKKEAVVFNHK